MDGASEVGGGPMGGGVGVRGFGNGTGCHAREWEFELAKGFVPGTTVRDGGAGGCADLLAKLGGVGQGLKMGGQGGDVVYFGGESGYTVDDDFWNEAYAGGNHRGFAGHGFKDGAGAAFHAGGQEVSVDRGVEDAELGFRDETYVVGGDTLCAEGLDFLLPAQAQKGDVEIGDGLVGSVQDGVESIQALAAFVVIT